MGSCKINQDQCLGVSIRLLVLRSPYMIGNIRKLTKTTCLVLSIWQTLIATSDFSSRLLRPSVPSRNAGSLSLSKSLYSKIAYRRVGFLINPIPSQRRRIVTNNLIPSQGVVEVETETCLHVHHETETRISRSRNHPRISLSKSLIIMSDTLSSLLSFKQQGCAPLWSPNISD